MKTYKTSKTELDMEYDPLRKKMMRTNWSAEDEAFLLKLWAEKQPLLKKTKRNGFLYDQMEQSFSAHSKMFSAAEIKFKVHNLTNKYKNERKKAGVSDWHLFAGVEAIIGNPKTNKIEQLSEDSICLYSPMPSPFPRETTPSPPITTPPIRVFEYVEPKRSPSPSSPSFRAAKRTKTDHYSAQLKETDEFIKEQFTKFRKTDERLIKIEERRNELLERLVKSCENVDKGILAFLKK